jgi:hypothetical protein
MGGTDDPDSEKRGRGKRGAVAKYKRRRWPIVPETAPSSPRHQIVIARAQINLDSGGHVMLRLSLIIIALVASSSAEVLFASIVPGYKVNWEAGVAPDGDNDNVWESTTATSALDWTFNSGAQTPVEVSVRDRPGIAKAYAFPAARSTVGTWGDGGSFTELQNVTIGLWVRPEQLTGRHVLWETGGDGAGFSITIEDGFIQATGQNSPTNRAIASRQIHRGQTHGLNHLVAAFDLDTGSGAQMDLYLNGVLAATGTTSSPVNDWAGGNGTGLGTVNGNLAGHINPSTDGFTDFQGEIAVVRAYENRVLTADEVLDNFAAPAGLTQDDLYASWDATSEAAATDDPWNPHFDAATAFNWDPRGTDKPSVNPLVESAHPGVLAAYEFKGGVDSRAAGPSHQNIGLSDGDFSVEMWLKPDDLAGQEILWEAGGSGSGSSIRLDGSDLYFRVKNSALLEEVMTSLTDDDVADFLQVVATVSVDDDRLGLYVNGQLAETKTIAGLTEWAGGADAAVGGFDNGIGGTNATTNGDLDAFTSLLGQIALVRYYTDDLTLGEVRANYDAIAFVPEPATGSLAGLLLFGLLLGWRRRRR